MGTWGTSLYAGDFAMDLRSTISAVAHLPFDADRLLEILCESEPDAANNPDDEDHTIFWLVVADQFAKRIGELADAGRSVGLESLAHRADAFGEAARRLDNATTHWNERYRADAATDDAPARVLNACIKRLSRLLLPVASTAKGSYGHDTFSFTPQSTMIPCLYDVPQLSRLPSAPQRWQLETQLVRERNRVSDALTDARLLIEATLARLG